VRKPSETPPSRCRKTRSPHRNQSEGSNLGPPDLGAVAPHALELRHYGRGNLRDCPCRPRKHRTSYCLGRNGDVRRTCNRGASRHHAEERRRRTEDFVEHKSSSFKAIIAPKPIVLKADPNPGSQTVPRTFASPIWASRWTTTGLSGATNRTEINGNKMVDGDGSKSADRIKRSLLTDKERSISLSVTIKQPLQSHRVCY
jgi:hypothetical protein